MRVIANRFNTQHLITSVAHYGCHMPIASRWQVSLQDSRGRNYDHYFVCKPTRKQLRKIQYK